MRGPDRLGGRIGNVDQGDCHPLHHLARQLMHRIRGENDEVGAAAFERLGLGVEKDARHLPISFHLKRFDSREIERTDQQFRGVKTAEAFAGQVA